MRLIRFIPLLAVALLCLSAPAPRAQNGAESVPSEWNGEALFDSTTTQEELLEMARSASTMSRFRLAEIYYQEALIRKPTDTAVMWELAALYRRTGRLEYARGLLTRAGRLEPDRNDIAEARRVVERDLFTQVSAQVDTLITAGKYDQALPRIGVLLSIDGENADVLAEKARCLEATGQSDAALTSIKLALARDPRDEFYRLRDEIALNLEKRHVDELEASAHRLLDSGNWVRGEATEVLQAILAQDPSNEWAREQFRALSGGTQPHLPSDPPAPQQVVDAVRDVAPSFAAALQKHLPAILIFFGVLVVFRSPLTRMLATRFQRSSMLAGDLARVDVADALRIAHVSGLSGVLILRTPDGKASVFMEDGQPVHCTGFGFEGMEALTYILHNVHTGRFVHRKRLGSVEHTIDQPLDLILAGGVAAPGAVTSPRKKKKSRMSELLETKSD
jgi:Tetratricopeptide repeat/Domain of unknown function (DUF4388)